MGHILARAMGVREDVEVDVIADEVESGDVFLLCSDGLMARVDDVEIAAVLADPDADGRAERLVKLTLERGAPDNVTIVTVGIPQTTMLRLNQPIHLVKP
jgi:serine/threonine protein phosphatase PrpC